MYLPTAVLGRNRVADNEGIEDRPAVRQGRPSAMGQEDFPPGGTERANADPDTRPLPDGLAPGCLARGLGLARGCGYGRGMRISAVLIDIDGVLTVSWRPLPGAVTALRQLRAAGLPMALVTNTTSRPRASIASTLGAAGFPVPPAPILPPPPPP